MIEDPTQTPNTETNGAGTAADLHELRSDVRGSMIANRSPWLDLEEPYDNLEIRAWLDYPKEVADLWTPQDNETKAQANARMLRACMNTFLDHRGEDEAPWRDEQGFLPPANEAAFWNRIPNQLAIAIIQRFFKELEGNPPSRASRRKKRRNFR